MAKTIFYSLAALVRRILFCHSKIKFISSRHRVISSMHKMVLTFESLVEILKCYHSNKTSEQYFPVVLTVYYVGQGGSNF